ncbi:ABC transporter ATP-binding protein [Nocardioides zeicaulis]|uniref:ABC transporter ATP-binding protein n=1 Tax=Nocardioides zeicaulis TaxID=1776857 RepID=A0ABV6E2X6_9ACTN
MLQVEGLSAGYDRMTVLRDVSLELQPGQLVLLLGPNGAGKTTLLSTVAGLVKPKGGSVSAGGTRIDGWAPERVARHGVRLVMQGHRVFPETTVEDNIRLGQINLPRGRRRPETEIFDEAFDVFGILGEKRKQPARDLSGGQQQMLALVQAWVARPDFMLCDEPSMGLALALVPEILTFLKRRTDDGMGVLLVEQSIDQPLRFADRVLVMRQGEIRFAEDRADVTGVEQLAQEMLGGAAVGPSASGPQ